MPLAPVSLFVYNRPDHVRRTLEALRENLGAAETEVVVFSDAAKTADDEPRVAAVRTLLSRGDWGFGSLRVVERRTNMGLAPSVIEGVSTIVNEARRVIVLEDDLVTSRYFLRFMNAALDFYEAKPRVFSISGYNLPPRSMRVPPTYAHDVYFNPRCSSWGWATWRDRWEKADWAMTSYGRFLRSPRQLRAFGAGGDDLVSMLIAQQRGLLSSWAIRWAFAHFAHDALAVYPVKSHVDNIGRDGSGVHCAPTSDPPNDLSLAKWPVRFLETPEVDEAMMRAFREHYRKGARWKVRHFLLDLVPELYRTRGSVARS